MQATKDYLLVVNPIDPELDRRDLHTWGPVAGIAKADEPGLCPQSITCGAGYRRRQSLGKQFPSPLITNESD